FSNPGSYLLRVVVENSTTDPVPQNDTLSVLIRQLENNPLDLGSVFLDNIETASFTETNSNKTGLEGIDRYDFSRNTSYGRIRSFVNTGIAYSGNKALTLDATQNNPGTTNYLYGTFNLASYDPALHLVRLDFRFKNHGQQAHADNKVWIRGNDSSPWIEAYDLVTAQNEPGSFKRSASIELSRLLANNVQNFSTSFQVRWGQNGIKQATDNEGGAGYTFDDIRLYTVAEDMQVVSIDSPALYSCGLSSSTPVRITVRNTTNLAINNVPVKFSVDGGTFVTETIPTIAANSSLQYSFSAAANLSAPGNHRIDAVVSYAGDTFRDNDTISLDLVNLPVISSFPYLENFETGAGSWYAAGKYSSWEYGTPVSPRINRAASGSKAWKTRLGGYYNDSELSYLYSPCFNISGMTNPTLSFSLAMDIEDCGNILCDAAWVEYSTDGGNNWIKLGNTGQGTNWYNKNYSGNQVWSQQHYTRWHVATTSLPAGSHSSFRVRFVFDSDEGVTKEGIAIDDIHIYENLQGIYDGPTLTAPITQLITGGNSWVNFVAAGKLVASLQPNNQVLGNTDVQVYLHQGSVRNYNGQYYHNRNITIKPMNPSLTDSATIRFYFPDSENEDLLNATGCSTCTKPLSAYDLGISKYSDPDDAMEDGVLTNSLENFWSFIHATKAVKVPFDNGYYAEFKVKDFSEFWLNNGGVGNNQALPVRLTNFNASKTIDGKDVLVTWITASEININRFEIEVAKGNQAYSNGDYVKIGELASQGNSANPQSYAFTDDELNKSGARYYRLKIIDQNGSFSYSVIRPVLFSNDITWRVFPNPANNFFTILFQLNQGERLDIKMYDISGRLLHQSNTLATGFVQKTQVDLNASIFAKGLYLVEARGGEMKQVFRLLKQ
ncbi:MAG TPA: T9SS type A sorting domain-containing protein, partial [Chitinophagaceae bacterium]|nr:T9SS type A sorting domain-containing protein [Chitinophagaceae bacterium]